MLEYIFVSYYKRYTSRYFKKKADIQEIKKMVGRFGIKEVSNDVFQSEKFTNEFGPSFDNIGYTNRKENEDIMIVQYQRNDHDDQKHFGVVTIDENSSDYSVRYLKWSLPIEGKWYRVKPACPGVDLLDIFIAPYKIYLRYNKEKDNLVKSIDLRQKVKKEYDKILDFNEVKDIIPKLETVICDISIPSHILVNEEYILYTSIDKSICMVDLRTKSQGPSVTVMDVGARCIRKYLNDYMIIFEKFVIMLQKRDLPALPKNYKTIDINSRKPMKDLTSLFVPTKLSTRLEDTDKVMFSCTGDLDNLVLCGLVHEDYGTVGILIMEIISDVKMVNHSKKLSYRYEENFDILWIPRNTHTSAIQLMRPIKSVLTGGKVKMMILMESMMIHVVYTYNKTISTILENKMVSSSKDAEVYGYLDVDPFTIIVYGWDICKKYKILI